MVDECKKIIKSSCTFTEAALLDNSQAAYNLDIYTRKGVGINKKSNLLWYSKICKFGDENAQINLGFMYISGQGVPKDMKKAAMSIKKSKRCMVMKKKNLCGNNLN